MAINNGEGKRTPSPAKKRYQKGLIPDDFDIPFFDEIKVVNK